MVIQYSICLAIPQLIEYVFTLQVVSCLLVVQIVFQIKCCSAKITLGWNFRSGIMGSMGRNFLRLLIWIASCFPEKLFISTCCICDCLSHPLLASSKHYLRFGIGVDRGECNTLCGLLFISVRLFIKHQYVSSIVLGTEGIILNKRTLNSCPQ